MRGELNRAWQNYGLVRTAPKRRRRMWGRTVGDVMVLACVIALVVWLISGLGSRFSVLGSRLPGVAMMPVGESVLLGLGAVCLVLIAGCASILWRDEREVAQWVEKLRERRIAEMEDPFAGEQAGSLSHEEVHRVLVAMAAEGREVRRLVCGAQDARLPLVEREEMLEAASRRVAQLVKCAEGLTAALRRNEEAGMRNEECGVRTVECGMRTVEGRAAV